MLTVRPMSLGQFVPPPVPPPIARPLLQQSVHARGARPYTFSGVIDEYHAPGVVYKNGNTKCSVDAAWLTGAVLGPAKVTPHAWPGVPGVRARAFEYGKAIGARDYQCEGGAFLGRARLRPAVRPDGHRQDDRGAGRCRSSSVARGDPVGRDACGADPMPRAGEAPLATRGQEVDAARVGRSRHAPP